MRTTRRRYERLHVYIKIKKNVGHILIYIKIIYGMATYPIISR